MLAVINDILESIIFPIKLYLGVFFFFSLLNKRNHFIIRIISSMIVSILISGLINWFGKSETIYISNLFPILLFSIGVYFSFKINIYLLAYLITLIVSIQQIPFNLTIICIFLLSDMSSDTIFVIDELISFLSFFVQIILTLFSYYIFYLLIIKKRKINLRALIKNKQGIYVGLILLFSNFFLFQIAMVVLEKYLLENNSYMLLVFPFMYGLSTITCLFAIFYLVNLSKKEEAEIDIKIMEQAIKKMGNEYANFKENINIINKKCHDMKYLIASIKDHQNDIFNSDSGKKYINELDKAIDFYGDTPKTKNAILDSILRENILLCREKHIDFTCFANGENLSFIEDTDLYVLFGNALSNAIEANEKVNEKERFIIFNISTVMNGWISIKIENCFNGQLLKNNNDIDSTKSDKLNHGFGLKSIKYIVEKYNGGLEIKNQDNIFSLNIIIPINQNDNK